MNPTNFNIHDYLLSKRDYLTSGLLFDRKKKNNYYNETQLF